MKQNENLLSQVFDTLRFPLIIAVIFIHTPNIIQQDSINPVLNSIHNHFPVYYYLDTLFSQVIARIAVPLFFFISGYLFFYKVEAFDKIVYLKKLKKRIKTLLIPYLFWNLLFTIIYLLMLKIPVTSGFFTNDKHVALNLDLLVRVIVGSGDNPDAVRPIAYQFWFIRDLIVCVIFSPVLFLFVRKTSWIGISLLALAYIFNISIPYLGARGFSTVSLFFFSAGAWFSIRSIDIVNYVKDFKIILIIYPVIAILDLLTKDYYFNEYINKTGILIGIVFCFTLCAILLKRKSIRPMPFLSAASFFLFAVHEPYLLTTLNKIIIPYCRQANDLQLCCIYIMSVAIVVILGISLYYVLTRISPRLTSLITGGRTAP